MRKEDMLFKLKCDKCGTEYELTSRQIYNRNYKKIPNLCKDCMKKYLSKIRSECYSKLSDEEKEKFKEKRNWYIRADEATKQKFREKQKKIYDSKSQDQKDAERKKNSETHKEMWRNKSDKEKEAQLKRIRQGNKAMWNSMTPEERSSYQRERFNNYSDEVKKRITEISRENITRYNNSLSLEEKRRNIKKMHNFLKKMSPEEKAEIYIKSHKWYHDLSIEEKENYARSKQEWYDNLSDEEKKEFSNKIKENYRKLTPEEWESRRLLYKEAYERMSIEAKKNMMRKALSASGFNNNFNKKFENTFDNSILINYFYYTSECVLSNNGVIHSWDYGIFDENGDLVMVVDLDGAYFHGDNCDYDGIHSKEEYDEKRALSIPDGIKLCIINELEFSKCFERLISTLLLNYNDYIESLFKEMRSIKFPFPKFTDIEIIKSYHSLEKLHNDKYHNTSINTRIGDKLIYHFHHSIWFAHRKSHYSPYDAWYSDPMLKECIRNRTIYQTTVNPNKILQGFNISKIAPKVSIFSAGRAKLLINKYLSEYNTIFDPFSGFSGRMLGTISMNKKYIGQDINQRHVAESNDIISFLLNNNLQCDAQVEEKDAFDSYGNYPCLFTCPPYADKEIWNDNEKILSCDDWIDLCLDHFKCQTYLFVVDETNKYKEYIVDEIQNKSHFGFNSEYIILINK